jgi:hypothetical protein
MEQRWTFDKVIKDAGNGLNVFDLQYIESGLNEEMEGLIEGEREFGPFTIKR